MKKNLIAVSLLCAFFTASAQKENAEALDIFVGGTFGKAKIIPKLDKLALAQISIDYRQASTASVTKTEKKFTGFGKTPGKSATASVTAYLETTDGELTDTDFQEITDHFYAYFQKTLKANGIDTVAWSTITATAFYKEGKEDQEGDKEQEKENGQWWTSARANKGNSIYNGANVFAFGKAKRATRFAEEIGAPAAYLCLTVDFVDIMVDVDVKTSGYKSTWTPSYNTVGQTTRMKSKTSVAAFMKVMPNGGSSLFWDEKSRSEILGVVKNIPAEMNYADELVEDESRAKKRSKLFSVSFSKKLESTPVVVSTTREKYKAAAKKALEHYADAFVAKVQEYKK